MPIDCPKTLAAPRDNPEADDSLISVRLLDGTRILTHPKNIVGYCNYDLHPGKISKRLLKEHDCLGKNCAFLKKNEKSTYWRNAEMRQSAREKAKAERLKTQAAQRQQADLLAELTEEFWSYLDSTDYEMVITSVKQVKPNVFTIFYVSDNPFADGNRFPDFLAMIKENHPRRRIILRHIKDETGRFVTIDEFYARKASKY